MSTIPENCPTNFCEEFTKQYLADIKEKKAWNTWHPIMERLLDRSIEMKPVYTELCDRFGYCLDGYSPELRLSLEAIWASGGLYNKGSISHKREVQKELAALHEEIPILAEKLCEALNRQRILFNTEDFRPGKYLNVVDMITLAGKYNGHYNGWVKDEIHKLDNEFDCKYWPTPEQTVAVIGSFESSRNIPVQGSIPSDVMDGRTSYIKDFVLALDTELMECSQLPSNFTFSNASMATIANVVLDLPEDTLATAEAVRIVRNRRKTGAYSKIT